MYSVKWALGIWYFATALDMFAGSHVILIARSNNQPKSPCPNIFKYVNDGERRYGIIQTNIKQFTNEIQLRVFLDFGSLPPLTYRGHIELIKKEDAVNNILSGKPIQYKVNFPLLYPVPKITSILLNGESICSTELSSEVGEYEDDVYIAHILIIDSDGSDSVEQRDEKPRGNENCPKPKASTEPSIQSKPWTSTIKMPQNNPVSDKGVDKMTSTTPTVTTTTTTTEADDGFVPDDSVNLLVISQTSSQDDRKETAPLPRSSLKPREELSETLYSSLQKLYKDIQSDGFIRNRATTRQKRQLSQHWKDLQAKFQTRFDSGFVQDPRFKNFQNLQSPFEDRYNTGSDFFNNDGDDPFKVQEGSSKQVYNIESEFFNNDGNDPFDVPEGSSKKVYKYTVTYKNTTQQNGGVPTVSEYSEVRYGNTTSEDNAKIPQGLLLPPQFTPLRNMTSLPEIPITRSKPQHVVSSQPDYPNARYTPQRDVTPPPERPITRSWQNWVTKARRPECGTTMANKVVPLFKHGDGTSKGDWPWLVAMFVKKGSDLDFSCGGTLVSTHHIVTAAHCVRTRRNIPLDADDMVVGVGVFNIQAWVEDPDAHLHDVMKIEQHPQYSGNKKYLDDIALLILKLRVEFSHYIIPACVWDFNNDQALLEGKYGTVVGWGRDENGLTTTPEPREGAVPIVSTNTCKNSNSKFDRLTSDTTLCAGAKNGVGPCNGDSGGGMYIVMNKKWYLRAIVSISLASVERSCDLEQFVVYTDASKYLRWLEDTMSKYP